MARSKQNAQAIRMEMQMQAGKKKPAAPESDAGFLIWCPGEDSNLHSVATART